MSFCLSVKKNSKRFGAAVLRAMGFQSRVVKNDGSAVKEAWGWEPLCARAAGAERVRNICEVYA